MIIIAVSMYMEAEPFIKQLGLKKQEGYGRYQIFRNNRFLLVITGVGSIRSASAISYVFGRENIKKTDIVINVGICGGKKEVFSIGECIMCNKIIDNSSNKVFYPDMLYKHDFKETYITTFSRPNFDMTIDTDCADMEASGFYIAASAFIYQHNIHIIKIISDYMDGKIDNNLIKKNINDKAKPIIKWIIKRADNEDENMLILNHFESDLIKDIAQNLKISLTMKYELIKLSKNYKIRNKEVMNILNNYKDIKCREKKEGKKNFEEIRQKLIKF